MKNISTVLFCLIVSSQIQALTPGNTSMNFLKIDSGARASALSGAFSSYGDDSYAIFYNPALPLKSSSNKIDLMHYEYFEDLNYECISAIYRINYNYSIGLGISYLYSGNIIKTVRADNMEGYSQSGNFITTDMQILFCNSFRIIEKISLGISIKYLRETIDKESAITFAFDTGLVTKLNLFKFNPDFSISILNLGMPVKFIEKKENLPVLIKSGISFGFSSFGFSNKRELNFIIEVEKPSDSKLNFRLGTEIWFKDIFALRIGYKLGKNTLSSISIGAGIQINKFDLNYAFVPYKYLNDTHRFSIGVKF